MVFVPVQIVPSAGALTFIWNQRPGKKREIHARARLAHGLLPGAHLARAGRDQRPPRQRILADVRPRRR
jgi:hypothetical protein